MNDKFLTLKGVSVKAGGQPVLEGMDWEIRKGEQWALVGASGSGKTVLAHTLMGRHFHSGVIEAPGVRIGIVDQQHRFRNRPGTTDLYYQQRFNSSDAESTITVAQELAEHGVGIEGGTAGADWERWLDDLHIRPLLDRPLIQLSNGENKRVQLAIALLEQPDMLIMDNPFLGLDVEGRKVLHNIINMLAGKGMQLLLITGSGELPAAITHVAGLDAGRLVSLESRDAFLEKQRRPEGTPAAQSAAAEAAAARIGLDPQIVEKIKTLSTDQWEDFATAVKMVDVSVYYGEKALLQHIDWEVRKGDRWNVSGPNGAGKSTILSLITGDNPQAYANEIWLFDRRRGTGETIWDIKRKIGFVSPELHLYFDYSANCADVIASGLFDTIGLFRPLNAQQEEHVLAWMQLLSLGELRRRRLAELSTGQQRMVLLARALIKNPPVLILDEPCQGLDDHQIAYFRQLIGMLCETFDKTLIYVSHYKQELPDCIDKFLRLENGKIVQ